MPINPKEYSPISIDDSPIGEDSSSTINRISVVETNDKWSKFKDSLAKEVHDEWRKHEEDNLLFVCVCLTITFFIFIIANFITFIL